MRVALYFNPSAGSGDFTAQGIARMLRDAGHDVDVFHSRDADVDDAIASRPEILAVAGGDGTVAESAVALWEARSPARLYVLPTGTANNIAHALGVRRMVPALAIMLAYARDRMLDIGVARTRGMERYFVESAGAGFFGDSIRRAGSFQGRLRRLLRRWRSGPAGEVEVRAAAAGLAREVRRAQSQRYEVSADGVDLSGDFVAVEVMNIASIGPRVLLDPGADSGDGALEVVLVRSDDREWLASFIESGTTANPPVLERRRAREIELRITGAAHLDDSVWNPGEGLRARIQVAGNISVLVPLV